MAEPLLRRTFSRLRGKEKYRRKTDPKLGDLSGKVDFLQSSSSSLSSSSSAAQAEPPSAVPVEDASRRGPQITVAKKQNWAKLSSSSSCSSSCSSSRDPPSPEGPHGLGSRAHTWEGCSGKAQVSKPAWSQRAAGEDGQDSRRRDFERDPGGSAAPPEVPGAALPEPTHSTGGYAEICVPSSGEKQGAYLQSLDRSSRAWVLSTGKTQAAEEASRLLPNCLAEGRQGGPDRESNIWYNPIPEEDDPPPRGAGGRPDYGNPWRKREAEGSPKTGGTPRPGRRGGPGCWAAGRATSAAGPSACWEERPPREVTVTPRSPRRSPAPRSAGRRAQAAQVEPQPAGAVAGGNGAGAGPSDSPGSQKRGGGASVMDRIKSPGTVRKLSLKMRKLPELRRKLSLRTSRSQRHAPGASPPQGARAEESSSSNVISRYHLDSSAPARPLRRPSRPRSAGKAGYLSDGDSPELLPKQGPPGPAPAPAQDPAAFRPYSLSDQPRCAQRVSGLLTVHLLGAQDILKAPKMDAGREVFCAIQVDGVTRARTALLTCRGRSLPLNHTFNLELERARLLKLVLLTPHPASSVSSASGAAAAARNRVCGLAEVAVPQLFRGSRSQQLCVRLEPRGQLYVKLTLLEQWDPPQPGHSAPQPASVFGVVLRHLVDKEGSALKVPLIIQKCVAEIEARGLKVVGLYRLCGSAAVKKELRDAFERDSGAVTLTEELYPDINVITGILKDYLRELPSPLITRTLYEVVLEAMTLRPPRTAPCGSNGEVQRSHSTVSLLECLPEPEKATLALLLDHLSLVASFCDSNRMTCQNLARGGRSFSHSEEIASAVDFKRHIEALHYLLQLWPIPTGRASDEHRARDPSPERQPSPAPPVSHNALQRRGQRLRLDLPQDGVVSRRGRGRLESPPCNRYAGDWSVCGRDFLSGGRDFLSGGEADYDEVAGSDSEEEEEEEEEEGRRRREPLKKSDWAPQGPLYVDEFPLGPEPLDLDLDAPFSCRLSLKDFDTLISDLERELSKQINICL
ncbi:hypothetical protein COCON_G00023160 [Conger conger]|uniref:Rho-GAP domain-containing protein n=1 Tax=Conger conger TaxID=82655 RepID=A0A9Q1DX58_CONCO|nr:hypothetical protein COCON_G00023160 [Conger conger]